MQREEQLTMGIGELKKYVGDESWLDMIFSSVCVS